MISTQLEALSHRPRRQLLLALSHRNPRDDTPPDIADPQFEDDDLELLMDYQLYHLPQLVDEGYIDYHREANTITKGTNFEAIEPLLKLIDEHRDELPEDWV